MLEFSGHSLSCFRGGRLVFDDLSFSVRAGGAILLVGPNGAGKSSLLRLLAGLIRPLGGTVCRDGVDIEEDLGDHRAATYYLAHADAVKPALTVEEDRAFWSALNGTPNVSNQGIERLGLSAQRNVPGRYLSSGQRRRTALARLLTAKADLWLLDEPSVGLDTTSVEQLAQMIADHRDAGGFVIAATHIDLGLEDAETFDITPYAIPPESDAAMGLSL